MSYTLLRHLFFKLASSALAIVGAVAFMLLLPRLIPGDAATVILGPRATPEAVAALRSRMGLDLSFPEQFLNFFGRLLQGDFGVDAVNGRPIAQLILAALPNTIILALAAMGLALLFGVPLALLSARRPGGWFDRISAFASVGFVAAPSFVISILLLLFFAKRLGWFPVLGAGEPGNPLDQLHHLVLPAFALAVGWIGYIARLLRSSLLEVLGEAHIRTMQAYGVSEGRILLKYALKPAWIPTLAIVGMGIGELLGGAVFAEVIFNRPGLGTLVVKAILERNYTIAQGGMFVIVALFVLATLIADLVQSFSDPRERQRLFGRRVAA
jgi:peptide/nickel transport system permease protein